VAAEEVSAPWEVTTRKPITPSQHKRAKVVLGKEVANGKKKMYHSQTKLEKLLREEGRASKGNETR